MRTVVSWLGLSLLLVLLGCPDSNKTNQPTDRRTPPDSRRKQPVRSRPGKRVDARKTPARTRKVAVRKKPVRKKPVDTTLVVSWFPSPEVLPLQVMAQNKLLEKHARKLKAKIKLKKFSDYIGAVHAYNTQKVQGSVMDSLNALRSAIRGTPSLYALPLTASRGSYAVVLRRGVSRRSFYKKRLFVEQYGLGHYLLTRYLSKRRKKMPKLQLINISVKDAGEAFLSDKNIKVAVTTRSYANRIRKKRLGRVLFDSSKDPHALQMALVLRNEKLKANPNALKAFAAAWAEAVALLSDKKSRQKTLASLAKTLKTKPAALKTQMDGWAYFGDLKASKKYLLSKPFRKGLEQARVFLHKQRMLSSLPSPTSLGFVFNDKPPAGAVISRLLFDSRLLP